MKDSEFPCITAVPRRGLTSVEAAEFLKREFPDVPRWLCWKASCASYKGELARIVGKPGQRKGKLGQWSWSRVSCSYPFLFYWHCDLSNRQSPDQWAGAVRIRGSNEENFILFSFLNSVGDVGSWYFASTLDLRMLDRFGRDLAAHFNGNRQRIKIHVLNGADVYVDKAEDRRLFLPEQQLRDIDGQVASFFEQEKLYRKLRLRYRRGFLFVGSPGTEKTMMIRRLVCRCHDRYGAQSWTLKIRECVDEDDIETLFHEAAGNAPTLVILEDMDSLTKESRVTRAGLLSQLDGLDTVQGLLIVATTNNPQDVDPALLHRPSRFDRVWHFSPPDEELRRNYLNHVFEGVDQELLTTIAKRTTDWTFAYLNELHTTAAIMSLWEKRTTVREEEMKKALDLLSSQFKAGQKNHAVSQLDGSVGFNAA